MGQSTDAQLCYGIAFDEGTEFPWTDDKYDNDIDDWWLTIQGFKPTVEIYDEEGNWLNGVSRDDKAVGAYYNERAEFRRTMKPLPVELVTHCSCDYPMHILAVKGTLVTASRGHAEEIDVNMLGVWPRDEAALLNFCDDYGIEYETGPRWWLSSLWC